MSRAVKPVRGASLVGRKGELAVIAQEFEAALEGRPGVVLVTGESGVGKSRLAAEARRLLEARHDALVLWGYALDSGEATPPYFPLARAFGPVLAASGQPLKVPPELRMVLAACGIGPGRPAKVLAQLDPDAERLRIFDALAEVGALLAASRPLVIVLDDMQWAAATVWDVLAYLPRALGDARLLILLAAREEVLHGVSRPAARAIAELNRQRLVTRISLAPLSPAELGQLATLLLGGPASPSFTDLLVARSDGNPFFVEEIIGDLVDHAALTRTATGWDVKAGREGLTPVTLRLAVGGRLESLPATTQRVLAAAAVLGRRFTTDVIARMLGGRPDEVEADLAPAAAAGVTERTDDGHWTFRHDTIRETACELWASTQVPLHAAAAAALVEQSEQTDGRRLLGAVARHWRLAGESVRAAEAAASAAQAAAAALDRAGALELARVARQMREQATAGLAATLELAEARRFHGETAMAAGDYPQAQDALRAALEAAQELGDLRLQAALWAGLGVLARRREAAEEAAGCLEAALELLSRGPGDLPLECGVLVELAGLNGLTRGRYEEAETQSSRAVELAEAAKDPRLKARAALALASSRARAKGSVEVRPLLEGALEGALAAGDLAVATEVCASLSNSYYWTGELGASGRFATRRLELAELGADVFGLRHAHSWLALLAFSHGEWEESRRLLAQAEPALLSLDSPEPIAFVRVVQGLVAYRLGDLDQACSVLVMALDLLLRADSATILWYGGLLALIRVERGEVEEAERLLAAQEERLAMLPAFALPARSARTVMGLAYAALGDRRRGRDCEVALRSHAGDFHWWPARRTLAALAALRGDREAALADLEALEARCRGEGLKPDLALGLLLRAELEPGAEARSLAECRRLLQALGMDRDQQRAARLGSRIAAPFGLLTGREQEVLRLVAKGLTNREIAIALFISERTVINHLSHIFAKLGVENRAGATAYAVRNGLA